MMYLFLQAVPTIQTDAVPPWVGTLSGTALSGVLLYYLITNALPKMQDRFHEALEKERESREKIAEKTFEEHREAIKAIIEKDERHHDRIMAAIELLPSKFRSQV
jgi:hypothetical protein